MLHRLQFNQLVKKGIHLLQIIAKPFMSVGSFQKGKVTTRNHVHVPETQEKQTHQMQITEACYVG